MKPDDLMLQARRVADTRTAIAEQIVALEGERIALSLLKAKLEAEYITAAGGEKNVGSNEEARKRALALMLAANLDYTSRVEQADKREADIKMASARLEGMIDVLRVMRLCAQYEIALLGQGESNA